MMFPIISFLLLILFPNIIENKTNNLDVEIDRTIIQSDKNEFSIIAVGDMMIGSTYPRSILPSDDALDYFKNVGSILQSADITFGNLEGTLFNGVGRVKKCSDPKICYTFKMPEHYVERFQDAGFDLLSIANNHIGDFGPEGINSTINILKNSKMKFAGVYNYPFTIDTIDGLIYSFTAFAANPGTLKNDNYELIDSIVRHLDTISDVVIVSLHGGAEGRKYRNITRQDEIFLNGKRGNPYKFARVAIDAGADLVLGHGPHVTRAVELYKNRLIAYSLGNFATYAMFNIKGENGIAPILDIRINKKGEFLSAKVHSIRQIEKGIPIIDTNHNAFKEIFNLTNIDFPEHELKFDTINYKILRK